MKSIYWVIIGIVVLIVLAGLGYWYFKIRVPKTISPNPSPAISIPSQTSPTTNPSGQETMKIKIFMIAVNDNGQTGKKIGCGDSAVAVTREIPYTQAVLKAAMSELVSIKDKNYGESGLYNPLYQSNLTLVSANIDSNGKAIVKFTGTLQLLGECEDPRIKAQFEETAFQFSSVKSVEIWINDKTLNDLTNLQG